MVQKRSQTPPQPAAQTGELHKWCGQCIFSSAKRKCSLNLAPVTESSERGTKEKNGIQSICVCLYECVSAETEYPISALTSRVRPQLLTSHHSLTAPHSPLNPQLLTLVLTSSLTGNNDSPDMCSSVEGRCSGSRWTLQANFQHFTF